MGFLALLVVQGCQRSGAGAELPEGADPKFGVPNAQRTEYATQSFLPGREKELKAVGAGMMRAGYHHVQMATNLNRGENLLVSPFSLAECFEMARLGAGGETDAEMFRFLSMQDNISEGVKRESAEDAGRALKSLRGTLSNLMAADVIRLANGIWISDQAKIKPEFKDQAELLFDAKIANTTFPNPGESQVNDFVKDQTRGKIPSILQGTNDLTRVVLVNAISFLDRWTVPFSKADTKREEFTLLSGEKVQHELMHKAFTTARYAKIGEIKGVSLSFQSNFKMILLLGPEGVSPEISFASLPKFHVALNDYQSDRDGEIKIPKWSAEFKWDIRAGMEDSGFKRPITQDLADFSGMSDKPLYIQQAIQKTMIRVDEEGAEAVAVTAMEAAKSEGEIEEDENKPFKFIANRPFAYAIVDIYGVPYFMGVVNDPR